MQDTKHGDPKTVPENALAAGSRCRLELQEIAKRCFDRVIEGSQARLTVNCSLHGLLSPLAGYALPG